MIERIVYSTSGVTILGAGAALAQQILLACDLAPDLVAADGGANMAADLGLQPLAVIGDLDSVDAATRAKFPARIFHRIEEQDSTDLEKCLNRIEAPGIIALGVLGPRLDHGLAALHTALARTGPPLLLVSETEVMFHCTGDFSADLPEGARVSLFPLQPVTGQSKGLEWSIEGLNFAPGEKIGTSNRMVGNRLELRFDGPGMIVIVEARYLATIWSALTA